MSDKRKPSPNDVTQYELRIATGRKPVMAWISPETDRQLRELQSVWGMTRQEVISEAIRMAFSSLADLDQK